MAPAVNVPAVLLFLLFLPVGASRRHSPLSPLPFAMRHVAVVIGSPIILAMRHVAVVIGSPIILVMRHVDVVTWWLVLFLLFM